MAHLVEPRHRILVVVKPIIFFALLRCGQQRSAASEAERGKSTVMLMLLRHSQCPLFGHLQPAAHGERASSLFIRVLLFLVRLLLLLRYIVAIIFLCCMETERARHLDR
jgi:hypothetical protein